MKKEKIYGPTESLGGLDVKGMMMICPGCYHGMARKVVCEALDEMDIAGKAVASFGIGCHSSLSWLMKVDSIIYAHGPAPTVATGVKRVLGDKAMVFTIQGDGDCAAIGAGYLVGAAARAEKITVLMLSNALYGTTGGQLAPTTLMGQYTSTTPYNRDSSSGYPLHVPELMATIKGVAYSARGAFTTPAQYRKTKKYVKMAFQKQIDRVGLSFVEMLVTCPTHWRKTPVEAVRWAGKEMIKEYPLGVFKNVDKIE